MKTVGIVASKPSNIAKNIFYILSSKNNKIKYIEINNMSNYSKYNLNKSIKELDTSNIELLIFDIDRFAFENNICSDISFDIMIYVKKYFNEQLSNKLHISSHNKNTKNYYIINIDDDSKLVTNEPNSYILTYGLNHKATITASSIDDDNNNLLISQQHSIISIFDEIIEPQEISISINEYNDTNIYDNLLNISTGLLFNIDNNQLTNNYNH